MGWGVNSILNMGVGALFASQANIQTTGNNISNVNTPGYSRQAVRQEDRASTTMAPGQVGQGVVATEVIRYFDAFVESNYLDKLGTSQRFESQFSQLRYIESVFNESNVDGISNSLTAFWNAWNKLGQQPDSLPTREALLAQTHTLNNTLNNASDTIDRIEDQVNDMVRQDVDTANQLLKEIAQLNGEINNAYLKGRINPNDLMDKRDAKVRELGGIIDVRIDDRGPGHYNVSMANGYTLVQDTIPFSLEVRAPQVENNLSANSPYKTDPPSTVHFNGSDSYEYTVEVVDGGDVGTGPGKGTATFKVSIDGGKTWLSDEAGNPRIFEANMEGGSQRVGELDIWFDAGTVAAGDAFVISPKNDVYWISPTSGPINISPQIYGDGTENSRRMSGGSLAGLLEFRDYQLGEYRQRLNAFSKSLAWEVNRVHSSGAGLEPLTTLTGTYSVGRTDTALGSPGALFTWSDRLQSGNMTFEIYDPASGKSRIPYPGLDVFSKLPGGNFDPSKHSLEDVRDAINAASFTDAKGITHTPFTAAILDGKLQISSSDPEKYSFAATADSTGLAAALGLNTFFDGDSAGTLAIRDGLSTNLNQINSGRVNGAGEMNEGDNDTAKRIYELSTKKVEIGTTWNRKTSQSMGDYYSQLVTKVGADTASVKTTAATQTALALDLYDRQESISGVNLDEEMSSLIKFQASYKAAAKLITTADEMMQTLLGLKQ